MGPTDVPWQPPVLQAAPAPPQKDAGVESAPETDRWSSRPRTFEARGGLGGPLGFGGLSFEYAPFRWFAAGVGAGFLPGGPQAGFMPRLRLPLGRWFAVGMGMPFSFGPYIFDQRVTQPLDTCGGGDCTYRVTRTWNFAVWGHVEPSVDFRLPNGMQVRLYGGRSKILNGTDGTCTSNFSWGCPSRAGEERTYGGIALGFAF